MSRESAKPKYRKRLILKWQNTPPSVMVLRKSKPQLMVV